MATIAGTLLSSAETGKTTAVKNKRKKYNNSTQSEKYRYKIKENVRKDT